MYKNPQVYDKLQCIFIHVPKAAGTSIELKLKEVNDKNQVLGGHSTATSLLKNMPKIYQNYFTFSLVRHPYDRLYSAYNYLMKMDTHENLGNEDIKNFKTFDDFVLKYLNTRTVHGNIHLKPQVHFLCLKEDIIVDYWEKYENISQFWNFLENKLKFESELPWLNKTRDTKKMEYSEELKTKIYELYIKDFITFNYTK